MSPPINGSTGPAVAAIEPIVGRYVHLRIDGRACRVYFEEAGQGIPLVCLHTAGADGRQFRHLLCDPAVTGRFRVLAFDMPWHGKSYPPDGAFDERYELTTQRYVDTVLAFCDGLGLQRPVAMGCSIGGRVVLQLANLHGPRFRALIGLEAADHQAPWYDTDWLMRPDVHGGEVCAALVSGLIAPQSPAAFRDETLWQYKQGGPGVFQGDLHFYRVEGDLRGRLGGIDTRVCPLYLLTGEYDFSCTPQDTERTAASIPGVAVATMAEVGHFPMSENPAQFRRYLLPVLDAIAAAPDAAVASPDAVGAPPPARIIPACLPFDPAPRPPREPLPALACDCHFHVFEDPAHYPLGAERGYTPTLATWDDYRRMADALGLARAVLVHPSVYGADHATFEALLRAQPATVRGVCVARADTPEADLARWHALGTRGTRFNLITRGGPAAETLPIVADKVRAFGWHLQLMIDVNRDPDALAGAARLGLVVVVDHTGHTAAGEALKGRGYRDLLARVRDGSVWVKLSGAYRITGDRRGHADVRPLWDALVEANPDRLVWGTDWPHPDIAPPMPNDGDLADLLVDWLTPALRQRILVDNPSRLYWADRHE